MFSIKVARFLAPNIKLLEIDVPRIARKREAGQSVIVRVHEHGERIPLTIADSNRQTITYSAIWHIVYRRGEAEMPARAEEIHHARAEGVRPPRCSPHLLVCMSDVDD
jgi:hypothetical protein